MSYQRMLEEEKRLQTEIADLLKRAEQTDAAEDHAYGAARRGDELPEELRLRENRLAKIREPDEDPDPTPGGSGGGHRKRKKGTPKDVTNQAADAPHLEPMIAQVEANTGQKPAEASADAGYHSDANVNWLLANKINPYIPPDKLSHQSRRQSKSLAGRRRDTL